MPEVWLRSSLRTYNVCVCAEGQGSRETYVDLPDNSVDRVAEARKGGRGLNQEAVSRVCLLI